MSGTNPVAQYQPTNFTAQTGTQYKAQIDANSVAAQRIVGRFAPHAQAAPDMTIQLDAGSIFDGTTLTEVAAQSTPVLVAPSSHPRIDRVVIDNTTGALQVVGGAEAVSPAAPSIPAGKSPIAQIALTTGTTAISDANITDERSFAGSGAGGFGAQTPIASAATCDLGTVTSHNAKITGSTSIASFGATASAQAPIYFIEFAGALTLVNGATLLLPGGANITTAAGDFAVVEVLGNGNWRVRLYSKVAPSSNGASVVRLTRYSSSADYYPNQYLLFAKVGVYGSGAAGQSGDGSGTDGAGAGGGSGGYSESVLTAAQIGTTQTITVGAGGKATTGKGGQGSASSFGSLITANGGLTPTAAFAAGASGTARSSADIGTGDICYPGGRGGNGSSGHYGGSAGVLPFNNQAGTAGNFTVLQATVSTGPGAGGAGGYNTNSTSRITGADGNDGRVDVWEYCSQ